MFSEIKKPIIIAGPCSAETEQQVLDTAMEIAKYSSAQIFRAGIWKPRTKPGNFEGVGAEALLWLQKAKQLTGLKLAIEVANAKHVELALAHDIDLVWIGARTTVNPFIVQEIADALNGNKIDVLVKNPLHADVDLWQGAIERIKRVNIKNVGAIHRGFSSYGSNEFRNPPMWHIPIELKRRLPELTLICDPSHICGNRQMLFEVAQEAIDLNFSGLMIETHTKPDEAWSDAQQQITPSQLNDLINKLILKKETVNDVLFLNQLHELRTKIDKLDYDLLMLLAERMKISEEIGIHKKEKNITILQAERWQYILNNHLALCEKIGLSKEFIFKYLDAVHLESINHQHKVNKQKNV